MSNSFILKVKLYSLPIKLHFDEKVNVFNSSFVIFNFFQNIQYSRTRDMTVFMPHIILPFLNLVVTPHLYTLCSSTPQTNSFICSTGGVTR